MRIKQRIEQSRRFARLKRQYKKYERFLIPGMLVLGVVVDFITFKTIEIETVFVVLVLHVVFSGLIMAFIHFFEEGKVGHNRIMRYMRLAAPLILQFSFGALLSASFIFYWFGGTFSVSWPLIIIIALLMISNETLRDYYLNPIIQIGVYTFLVFTVVAILIPFALKSIDPWTFILAGAVTLVFVLIYVQGLSLSLRTILFKRKYILYAVFAVLISVNGLYLLKVIPPAPLSVRHVGVYHSVNKAGNVYNLTTEGRAFSDRLIPGQIIHATTGETITVFSSIFAPQNVRMITLHRWDQYDENNKRWMNRGEYSFSLIGGRDAGYRGYTNKVVSPGKWRVRIQTLHGQSIGQVTFKVKEVDEPVELITVIK